MERILVVDDEEAILELVTFNLQAVGYKTLVARDGLEALGLARAESPDLIILDVMLPGLDGFEVCRILRQERGTSILMLTAREAEADKVLGLELGADDYLTKPFSPRELIARVRAILRRGETVNDNRPLTLGSLIIDQQKHLVTVAGRTVDLTPTEYQLLLLLATNRGRVYTREVLLGKLWQEEFAGDSRTIDVHIRHLREKLGEDSANPRFLVTVRGVGYKFVEGTK